VAFAGNSVTSAPPHIAAIRPAQSAFDAWFVGHSFSKAFIIFAALARNAFFIDPEYVQFGWFRKIKEDKEVAKTGDAQKFVLLGEGALKVNNEKGLGVAADLFGLSSST
jgi:hypothetical protein